MTRLLLFILVILYMTGCSTRGLKYNRSYYRTSPIYAHKHFKKATMRPYMVRGVAYYPTTVSVGETFNGIASWYGPNFNGRLTSDGEVYNMYGLTAANKILPMNTIVKVTNINNNRSVIVRINDRGPFVNNRIIDLSKAAASRINMIGTGTAPVRLQILGFANKGVVTIPQLSTLQHSPKTKVLTNFVIQIGAFTRYSGALITQKRYNNIDGYKAIIKDTDDNGRRLFKVWLTGFNSEAEARGYIKQKLFHGAFITRE